MERVPSLARLKTDAKEHMILCKSQVKVFNYLFGVFLEEQLFTHTHRLTQNVHPTVFNPSKKRVVNHNW